MGTRVGPWRENGQISKIWAGQLTQLLDRRTILEWACTPIVTILFPYRSVLLFFHTQHLLTWRGRRIYTNTTYLFLRTASSFSFFDLSMDLANS